MLWQNGRRAALPLVLLKLQVVQAALSRPKEPRCFQRWRVWQLKAFGADIMMSACFSLISVGRSINIFASSNYLSCTSIYSLCKLNQVSTYVLLSSHFTCLRFGVQLHAMCRARHCQVTDAVIISIVTNIAVLVFNNHMHIIIIMAHSFSADQVSQSCCGEAIQLRGLSVRSTSLQKGYQTLSTVSYLDTRSPDSLLTSSSLAAAS